MQVIGEMRLSLYAPTFVSTAVTLLVLVLVLVLDQLSSLPAMLLVLVFGLVLDKLFLCLYLTSCIIIITVICVCLL